MPYDVIDRYEVKPYKGCSIRASSLEREACNVITYGSLTLGLQRAALWPRQQPEDVLVNIEALAAEIKDLRVLIAPAPGQFKFPDPVNNHENCIGINFQHAVWAILAGIMNPVLQGHRTHMTTQKQLLQ